MNEKTGRWVSVYQLYLNIEFHRFMDLFKRADSKSIMPRYEVRNQLLMCVSYLDGMEKVLVDSKILESIERAIFYEVAFKRYEDLCQDVWNGYNTKLLELRGDK